MSYHLTGRRWGSLAAWQALSKAAEREISEEQYEQVKEKALALGIVRKGRARGGPIALAEGISGSSRYKPPATPSGNGRR